MNNPVMPKPHQILDIIRETNLEYTFRIETDMRPQHGQFFQLSLPRVGECPISVSNFGEGWMEFTIRSVGKVTDQLFSLQPGDELFVGVAHLWRGGGKVVGDFHEQSLFPGLVLLFTAAGKVGKQRGHRSRRELLRVWIYRDGLAGSRSIRLRGFRDERALWRAAQGTDPAVRQLCEGNGFPCFVIHIAADGAYVFHGGSLPHAFQRLCRLQ